VKLSALAILLIVFHGCKEEFVAEPSPEKPMEITVSQLRAAPDTVVIAGRQLTLSTELWRDFMPISPPEGKPLTALLFITASDTARLDSGLIAEKLWIINGEDVWCSEFSDESTSRFQELNMIVKIARNGPLWGPSIYVDVIVRLNDGHGTKILLRASHQWINRTD
jgi:hypothetical protein